MDEACEIVSTRKIDESLAEYIREILQNFSTHGALSFSDATC